MSLKDKNKITRHIGAEKEQITFNIDEIKLYEMIELDKEKPYLRLMNIREELINKTAISILNVRSIDFF